jgi:hypothetical protein
MWVPDARPVKLHHGHEQQLVLLWILQAMLGWCYCWQRRRSWRHKHSTVGSTVVLAYLAGLSISSMKELLPDIFAAAPGAEQWRGACGLCSMRTTSGVAWPTVGLQTVCSHLRWLGWTGLRSWEGEAAASVVWQVMRTARWAHHGGATAAQARQELPLLLLPSPTLMLGNPAPQSPAKPPHQQARPEQVTW